MLKQPLQAPVPAKKDHRTRSNMLRNVSTIMQLTSLRHSRNTMRRFEGPITSSVSYASSLFPACGVLLWLRQCVCLDNSSVECKIPTARSSMAALTLRQECLGVLQHSILSGYQWPQHQEQRCTVAKLGHWACKFPVHFPGLLGN